MNLPQYPVFRELPAPAGKLESFSELNPDCTLAQSQGSAPTTSAASPAVRRIEPLAQGQRAADHGPQHQETRRHEEVDHFGR